MIVQPLDIVYAPVRLRLCTDARPCLVLYPPHLDRVIFACISGEPDLFDRNLHFRIEPTHPDFPATGLKRRSYVLCDELHEIRLADILKHLGRFDDRLAGEFKNWYGM